MPLWIATAWLAGCRCAGAPPPAPPAPDHYGAWEDLLRLAATGDRAAARVVARDLTHGAVSEEHPAAAKVGAGLGFLQVADGPEEVPEALSRVASACGDCHAAAGVPAPEPPPATHPRLLARAAHGAVFGVEVALPPEAAVEAPVRAAWGAPDRVAAVAAACLGCHAGG